MLVFLAFQAMPSSLSIYLSGPTINAPDTLIGLTVGIATLSAIISRPFTGAGVDLIGRRIFFVIGMIGMALTLGTVCIIPSLLYVFIIRFLHGISWGVANTAATTIATDIVPRSRFGEGIGFFSLSNSIALAIAPAMAIFLILNLGLPYEVIVVLTTTLVLVAFVFSFFLRYKKAPQNQNAPTAQTAAHPQNKKHFSFKALFERRAVVPAIIVFFCTAVYGTVISFMALHAAAQGIGSVSVYFTTYAVSLLVSRPTFGKLVDKHGYPASVIFGLTALMIALVFVAFATSILHLIAAGILFGFGQGSLVAALQTMAVADVPYERRGAATSTFFVGFDGGIGAGAVLAGFFAGAFGYTNLFLIVIAYPAIALVLYLLLARKRTNPTALPLDSGLSPK